MGRIDLRSQSLDLLRFPLAVVVLTIHIFSTEGITFQGTTSNFEDYPFFMEVNRYRRFLSRTKCTYLLFHFRICVFLGSRNDKRDLYP